MSAHSDPEEKNNFGGEGKLRSSPSKNARRAGAKVPSSSDVLENSLSPAQKRSVFFGESGSPQPLKVSPLNKSSKSLSSSYKSPTKSQAMDVSELTPSRQSKQAQSRQQQQQNALTPTRNPTGWRPGGSGAKLHNRPSVSGPPSSTKKKRTPKQLYSWELDAGQVQETPDEKQQRLKTKVDQHTAGVAGNFRPDSLHEGIYFKTDGEPNSQWIDFRIKLTDGEYEELIKRKKAAEQTKRHIEVSRAGN